MTKNKNRGHLIHARRVNYYACSLKDFLCINMHVYAFVRRASKRETTLTQCKSRRALVILNVIITSLPSWLDVALIYARCWFIWWCEPIFPGQHRSRTYNTHVYMYIYIYLCPIYVYMKTPCTKVQPTRTYFRLHHVTEFYVHMPCFVPIN